MTATEAANFLRIHPHTLRRLVREGRLQPQSGDFEVAPLVHIRQQQPAPVKWRHNPPSQDAIEAAADAERWEWALAIFGGWGMGEVPARDISDLPGAWPGFTCRATRWRPSSLQPQSAGPQLPPR